MKLYIIHDERRQYIYSAVVIAENRKEALQMARDSKDFIKPAISEEHEITPGIKTMFAE